MDILIKPFILTLLWQQPKYRKLNWYSRLLAGKPPKEKKNYSKIYENWNLEHFRESYRKHLRNFVQYIEIKIFRSNFLVGFGRGGPKIANFLFAIFFLLYPLCFLSAEASADSIRKHSQKFLKIPKMKDVVIFWPNYNNCL